MRILIAGGTGLVGTRLVKRLQEAQHQPVVLTRRPDAARQKWGDAVAVVAGNPTEKAAWMDRVADCDAVVNLTGEHIFARRWNAEFKEILRTSRVNSTENVIEALAKNPRRADGTAKVLVNASAIGYYGPRGDEELTEASPPGSDAQANLCLAWERAASAAADKGIRLVIVRIGVVLDREGGALKQMLPPFKMFVGGKVGSGRQYVSWIHHDDLAGLIAFALDNAQASGPMNGTAPNPVTNAELAKAIGRVLGRPSFMPAPAFALRLALGEVADVVTTGQRVMPQKAREWGYQFKFTDIDSALRDVLQKQPAATALDTTK